MPLALQAAVYAGVCHLPDVRARAIKLAKMVATRLGGDTCTSSLLDSHLRSFKSKVVPVGSLELGVCR